MASNDNGRVGGRIRRYARVTTTMTGLAARMAGERYLGLEIDRSKHAADLRDALGGLTVESPHGSRSFASRPIAGLGWAHVPLT